MSYVKQQPLPGGRRLDKPATTASSGRWPLWGIRQAPAERSAAVRELVRRLGLDRPGVPTWRLRAGLAPWFAAGWCPAGLLWAIDHHPDRPDHHRGDALRGASDPIRVLLAASPPGTAAPTSYPRTCTATQATTGPGRPTGSPRR